MGAQQSSEEDACQPCLGIGAPFSRRNVDPLGSPMPDSPFTSRQKRREFSSRYGGLEKEVSSSGQSSFYESNNSQTADVHEGSVRDGRQAKVDLCPVAFRNKKPTIVGCHLRIVYRNKKIFGVNSVCFCCSENCGNGKYRMQRQPFMQSISLWKFWVSDQRQLVTAA